MHWVHWVLTVVEKQCPGLWQAQGIKVIKYSLLGITVFLTSQLYSLWNIMSPMLFQISCISQLLTTITLILHLSRSSNVLLYLDFREGPPSQQANRKQNGCILQSWFYLTNTNNYFTGSTNAAFESQVANAASGEEWIVKAGNSDLLHTCTFMFLVSVNECTLKILQAKLKVFWHKNFNPGKCSY
jgi:hypothetical protein